MKKMMIGLTLAVLAVPAAAQQAPAPAAAPAAAKYSTDATPIETLAADPQAKAVIDKEMPELLGHPAFEQFKVMTLAQLAPMSQGSITPEILAKVDAELAKIK